MPGIKSIMVDAHFLASCEYAIWSTGCGRGIYRGVSYGWAHDNLYSPASGKQVKQNIK